MKRNIAIWSLLLIAFIGFLDATYLAVEHFRGEIPPCSITLGCEAVTTSGYATILTVPVALLGSIYYLVAIVLLMLFIQTGKEKMLIFFKYLSILGLLASAYFVYLQISVIGAICQWCMVSAGTSTLLFLVSWLTLKNKNSEISN
jgi:uncharacterized membrane protein